MDLVATAMHLAGNLWRVSLMDKDRDVHVGVCVVDAARAMGATHLVWRDTYDARGKIVRNHDQRQWPLSGEMPRAQHVSARENMQSEVHRARF